jgi:hypothetical protein
VLGEQGWRVRAWLGRLILCGSVLGATHAFGQEVYTCQVDGHKVFSQQPCGGKVETVKTGDERSIRVALDMPQADIDYLCHIAMRAWDSAGDRNSRSDSYSYHQGYYYTRSAGQSRPAIRGFILNHVSNLGALANEDSQLYHLVSRIADSYSVNSSGSNITPAEYEANRNELSAQCRTAFADTLSNMATSRFDDQHDTKPKPKVRPNFSSSTLRDSFPGQ